MTQDKARQLSLTLASLSAPLHVIRFSGREALNQSYRFEVELLGEDPGLDLQSLLEQPAFLGFGSAAEGVHGLIHEISSSYLTPNLCHYQVVLGPRLTLLERSARRRAFYDLSVPEILERLLASHGLGPADYRFELDQGTYPPRPHSQQHEQNDLQWLNRLCEEEGIHYHFEHSPRQHVLVFAEDPQAFPEHPGLLRYCDTPRSGQPAIDQLHERHAMPSHVDHPPPARTGCPPWPVQARNASAENDGAANQAGLYGLHSTSIDHRQRHELQCSRRALERLRCESRQIQGRSNLGELHCADVRFLSDHPRQALNDQWLITEVQHWGEQRAQGERLDELHHDRQQDASLGSRGYYNHFKAIPWATPFRPALRQARPRQTGYQLGTVLGPPGQSARPDAQGRLPIQLQGALHSADTAPGCWIPLGVAEGKAPQVGSQVLIECVDHDPEQLVICGFLDNRNVDVPPTLQAQAEQPAALQPATECAMPDAEEIPGELYLYEQPQKSTHCLGNSVWYIVRMPRPGLKELARLGRDDILLEGRSNARGMAVLSPYQRHRLALELADTPEQLWLLYPGQCLAVHEYIRQRWSPAQRRAFLQASLNNSADGCPGELNSVYEWLIKPSAPR
ncbi:type VI secretion system tip protein VgrG [Pseudomonas fuscovaginae UPB0736]|uniref:type VI secretion system Vgr family protein n=1 Tax=Pseudomonas asplenii TaxID=53407 RepID=UPI0002898BAA|nr:type VI secretion system tip protein TssI/VgrG [Pseudomonas fuscovaginae]UUQ64118.1 type VI secretion system tip protein VgrG [Pseudomonas fuscovaginae UPB0736]